MISSFGIHPNGQIVNRCTISSEGIQVQILTLGGIIQSLMLSPTWDSVVLSYPDLFGYLKNPAYLGAIVGRFANRIGNAQVNIEGVNYTLNVNQNDRHTLHGGVDGLSSQVFEIIDHRSDYLKLQHVSPHGHMGFPGTLTVDVLYQVTPYQLSITLNATTDRPTICNLTSHSYFNLSGEATIQNHTLQVHADTMLELQQDMIPTGKEIVLEHSEYDLRNPRQLSHKGAPFNLDHHFCAQNRSNDLKPLALLQAGDITMTLKSTSPGLQVYTGQWLPQANEIKQKFQPFAGVALEPQHWPDAPHHPHFPSTLLRPGECYENVIILGFRTSTGKEGSSSSELS